MFEDFEESLNRLGKKESEKTKVILEEIDEQLYENEEESEEEEKEEIDEFIRGYDAILQQVDENEIKKWKKRFHYLRICGYGYELSEEEGEFEEEEGEDDDDINVENHELSDELNDEQMKETKEIEEIKEKQENIDVNIDQISLCVVGRKIIVKEENIRKENDEVEEVICTHGILEEIIAIDKTIEENESLPFEEMFVTCDPKYSQKVEVVNSLFDALLPDIITLLTPLAEKLIRVSRENNLNYDEHDNTSQNSYDYCDDNNGFFGNSDESEGEYEYNW